MDRAQAALRGRQATEDERRKILKARAKALARELKTDGKEQGLVKSLNSWWLPKGTALILVVRKSILEN